MFESIFTTTTAASDTSITALGLLSALFVSFVLGILVSLVYMKTHGDRMPSKNFAITLVILPAVITIIILLVGNNIARAFSLAGAFSIIRFRSAPGDPKDITYVLFTMALGLACGMGFILYAVIAALILCGVMLLLEWTKFGSQKYTSKLLKITIPENLDYQNAFEDIMEKYTVSYHLSRVKTADLGSVYELFYGIMTKNELSEKEFIDELRCRNGNLNITLVLGPDQTAEGKLI